jgi:hypothetical protein
MSEKKSIFMTGSQGASVADEFDSDRVSADALSNSFRLESGQSAQVLFLDKDGGVYFKLHQWFDEIARRYVSFACISDIDGSCAGCEEGKPVSYVSAWSILDLTARVSSGGFKTKPAKKLLIAKAGARKKLAELFEQHSGLKAVLVKFSRTSDSECATGEGIEVQKKIKKVEELKKLLTHVFGEGVDLKELMQPLDYNEVIPVLSREQMQKLIQSHPVGSKKSSDSKSGKATEEVNTDSLDELL